MSQIDYYDHRLQTYFKNEDINNRQAKLIFKFRTHMLSEFQENFRGMYGHTLCSQCFKHLDSQNEIVNCQYIKENVNGYMKVTRIYGTEISVDEVKILENI